MQVETSILCCWVFHSSGFNFWPMQFCFLCLFMKQKPLGLIFSFNRFIQFNFLEYMKFCYLVGYFRSSCNDSRLHYLWCWGYCITKCKLGFYWKLLLAFQEKILNSHGVLTIHKWNWTCCFQELQKKAQGSQTRLLWENFLRTIFITW